ncbi:MAG: hypothetical protein V1852_25325, partial [Pseudomonadota bacterium]
PTKPLHYFVTWLNHVSSFLYRNYSIFPISTMLSVHKKALHYFDLINRVALKRPQAPAEARWSTNQVLPAI